MSSLFTTPVFAGQLEFRFNQATEKGGLLDQMLFALPPAAANRVSLQEPATGVATTLLEFSNFIGERYAAFHVQRILREPTSALVHVPPAERFSTNDAYGAKPNYPRQFNARNDLNLFSIEENVVRSLARQVLETLPQEFLNQVFEALPTKLRPDVVQRMNPKRRASDKQEKRTPNIHNLNDAIDLLVFTYREAYRRELAEQVVRLTGVPEALASKLIGKHETFAAILSNFANEFFQIRVIDDPYDVARSALSLAMTAVGGLPDWSPDSIQTAIQPLTKTGPGGTVSLATRWAAFLADATQQAAAPQQADATQQAELAEVSPDQFRKLVRLNSLWRNNPRQIALAAQDASWTGQLSLATQEGKQQAIAALSDSIRVADVQAVPELTAYQAPLEVKSDPQSQAVIIHAFDAKSGKLVSMKRFGAESCRAFPQSKK